MRFSFPDVNDHDPFPEGYFRPNGFSPEYINNPHDVREAILSDLELERRRIREQLLVASDAHKLMMEAGLRIELSLERQMAIVRGDDFSAVFGSTMRRYDIGSSTMVPCGVRSVKDRLGPRQGIREYENFSPIRDSEPTFLELNPTSEFSKEKFEVTFPAETQEPFSGTKRKAETPPPVVSGVSDISSNDAKKNRKKEWSCTLCKLNFSNVQMLKDHVQGREHLGYHELEQNADESKKKIEKESTSQATLNIDDSRNENGNMTVQMLKLTNNSKKFMTLSGGVDHESVMTDNRSRGKNSGEFVEIAQKGGVYAEKACTHEKETNNTSSEIAVTNDIYNMEQAKAQKNVSGSKRKAETQPLEAVGASKIPSAGAKKNPKQEFSCRPCKLFQVFLSNEEINEHMQGMKHKTAERRERFGTGLVPKDINSRVKTIKASCNCYLDQVIQNSEELKEGNGEKNESAKAATPIIDNSMKINGNPAVRMLKLANNNEKFMAPSTSQNDESQVGKTTSVEQETTMISATKDKNIHKLEQTTFQGNVSEFNHKADTQPLEVVGASKIPSAGAKKKLKQEFTCALCQVSVPTEIIFNGHIQGKRHKAAERRKMLVLGSVPKDNNSLANIAEEKNNPKMVRVYKSEAEMSPRTMLTYPKSVQIDEVVHNSEELKKEIKEKNELAEGRTQNIDHSKKEYGNLAVQMLERVTNNEKFMASSTLLKVESENEKKVDAHKRRQNHSVEFRGVAQNGESQAGKAFSEEEETTKISYGIDGIEDKDMHKLVEVNKIEALNGKKSLLENGDVNLKYVSEIGSRTEEVTSGHNKGKAHLEILLEDSQSGLPEKKNTMEKETKATSFKKLGATDNCNSKQAMLQGNASGAKRKADPETQPAEVGGASKISSVGAKKKLKQVFTCSLCRVVVADENIFNEHIQGMRHKANMEAQRPEWFTNADDSREETGEIIELACQAMKNIDDPKVEKGISALELVKFTSSTENFDPVSRNIHSRKLLEVAHIGGSQPEKAFTAEQETYKVSADTEGTKDDPSLEQGRGKLHSRKFLVVGSDCGSQGKKATSMEMETNSGTNNNCDSVQNADESEQEAKGESESQLIYNTCNSKKETNNLTDKTLKIGDGKKRFKFMCRICKVGSNTERVMIAHNSKLSHLEKLRVEKAADGVPKNEKEKTR